MATICLWNPKGIASITDESSRAEMARVRSSEY
ncbi:hypothetical protein SNOG_13080 [Parastagonospora nodorum SN15]|uniref:Uncharacterized protein n=1 Tax=Phaeosphaeria nodorum (strain SN15 / ATCC MYA-4574 / FGSC 10173) TaxID=321614 RepID=Q0U584_PHANO|nr:hypothetical protein SNOG_13080 [Parastagonospora nodorum SN15]EAT79407.1 hypothetical protein SNOG_13080 [Parastagonospora nodorum SN15]